MGGAIGTTQSRARPVGRCGWSAGTQATKSPVLGALHTHRTLSFQAHLFSSCRTTYFSLKIQAV